MYEVNDYGRMMADPVRMHAYTEALRRAVKPGSVVVDVGTGLGVFALLAAQLGARKVYAIDTNPCIHLAREVAKKNGYADRIEFIQKSVFDVELPEKADVLIADCRGAFTLHALNLEIMMRARGFLREGGAVIPDHDDLFVAVLQWSSLCEQLESRWRAGGFDWSACRADAMSSRMVAPNIELTGADHLVSGARWATVDFKSLTSANVRGQVETRASRAGEAQFLALWFVSTVAEGLTLGSAPPGHAEQVYTPLLLPLEPPLPLAEGDTVTIRVDALHSKHSYVFAWKTSAPSGTRQQMTDAGVASLEFSMRTGQRTPHSA